MVHLQNIKLSGIPTRSIIWIMLFTCTFVLYMIRINLSIMILAMVGDSTSEVSTPECAAHKQANVSNVSDSHTETSTLKDYGTRYDWDTKLQGLILGCYFWGFTISGLPGGGLAERFGPTKLATFSFVFSGILTILGPLAASWSPYALIVTRFLVGLLGGVVFPCCHCLVSRWAPPDEKGKFIGALLGGSLGTVVTWPMLGAVIESIGWVWGFYVSGIIVMVWVVSWWFLVSDSPDCHPGISEEERNYIMNSLAGNISKEKKIPPYKDIFLSIPAWALFLLHFGNLWGLFFLMTAGPNFMSTVLGFNLGHTGILAALPYLARMISGFIFGAIGDFILRRNLMKKTTIRKFFVLFSHVIPGLLLIVQTFTGCHVNWAIVLVTMSLGFNGASTLTNLTNSQDLAPNFAGTLYGIANCLGSTTGFISPLIVGYMTSEHNGLDEWHTIFHIGASVYIASGIMFCFIGSGEVQPWNAIEKQNDEVGVKGIENIAFDSTNEIKY